MSEITDVEINSFLRFGFNLNYACNDYKINFNSIDKSLYDNYSEDKLVQIGIKELYNSIENTFESGKKNVIPISGGLDSRAILAALQEFTEVSNINTYTYGTPGTLDYDIGNLIAKKVGTKHTSYPLTKYKYSQNELLDISKKIGFQTVLFHHPPIWKLSTDFGDGVIWSGFLGETLSGSHFRGNNLNDLNMAKKEFININTYAKSIKLDWIDEVKYFKYITDLNLSMKDLSLCEQLDFANRQIKFIAPHVLMRGFDYKTPFLDSNWVSFTLSIKDSFRINQNLYKKILLKAYPKFFEYPTKANSGAKLKANEIQCLYYKAKYKVKIIASKKFPFIKNPGINYLDFGRAIREREDLKLIIYNNIMDLKNRKILDKVNIDEIWKKHINGKTNYADALLVLASLELNLKAKETMV